MVGHQVPKKFQVAFSFAGEHRDLIRPYAAELERRLGANSVFFDDWYQFYLAGFESDRKLQKIYMEGCSLVVACLSGRYQDKSWTQTEFRSIRARYMDAVGRDKDRILLMRVDEGEVDGVLANDITVDLVTLTPAQVAELIIARLDHLTGGERNAEPARHAWPALPPDLRWPMADHHDARAAFGDLLTEGNDHRLLLVSGSSGTGKSMMSRQMLVHCVSAPELRCGRFDFKGTTGMEIEMAAFVHALEARPSNAAALNQRFIEVLDDLKRAAVPTVLIFDSYEQAGDVTEWIQRFLLLELLRAPWLRVVILGQPGSIPASHGTVWESVAAPEVALLPPGPADWCEYIKMRRPDEDVNLDFITQLHASVDGQPTLLAGLAGPQRP